MMYKTNFLVLVLQEAKNKVVIWDDFERRNVTEISFNCDVKAILLRKDILVVILDAKTFMFSFLNLKMIEHIETGSNPLGLGGITTSEACLHKIVVINYPK